MAKKLVTREEVDGFLGIDTQINSSENPLEEAIEILTDLINGEYSVDQLRRDMHEWKNTWTVVGTKERPAPMPAMSPFEPKVEPEDLLQKAMEANKARTEISGKYNTRWTPNAKNIYSP
jgi:hypothetical protein